jgi:hypothetical protein
MPSESDVAVRPVRIAPATIALPCSREACAGQTIRRLVIGAVARPAVQRPATAPEARRVLRPTLLMPGQIRSCRR